MDTNGVKFCPKNGLSACCICKRVRTRRKQPFGGTNSAEQYVREVFNNLEPGVKNILTQRIVEDFLHECMQMGLREDDIKHLVDDALKKRHERDKALNKTAGKLRKQNDTQSMVTLAEE